MLIGIIGFQGSGKDTAAEYLVNHHDFRRESFANSLKDAVSQIFGWDRMMLEGITEESREWREKKDEWWAKRLEMPDLTPRWVLQHWGTEVLRNNFHQDLWIASLEKRLLNSRDNVVISDCRFPNEMSMIKRIGGILVRVKRGPDPEWIDTAIRELNTPDDEWWMLDDSEETMRHLYPKVHQSEWVWINTDFDYVLENNGSKQDLFSQVESIVKSPESDPLDAKVNVAYEVVVGNWHRLS